MIKKQNLNEFETFQIQDNIHNFVGLTNQSATCYMNSVLQQLYAVLDFRKEILSTALPEIPENQLSDAGKVLRELQIVFHSLKDKQIRYFNTRKFCQVFKWTDNQPINVTQQQDANEFLNLLFNFIDEGLRECSQQRLFHDVFGGSLIHQVICQQEQHKSERIEQFYTVSLDVKNKSHLLESLSRNENEQDNNNDDEEDGDMDYDDSESDMSSDEDNELDGIQVENRPGSYYKYKIIGIVVHSGTHNFGHYYSYIRDHHQEFKIGNEGEQGNENGMDKEKIKEKEIIEELNNNILIDEVNIFNKQQKEKQKKNDQSIVEIGNDNEENLNLIDKKDTSSDENNSIDDKDKKDKIDKGVWNEFNDVRVTAFDIDTIDENAYGSNEIKIDENEKEGLRKYNAYMLVYQRVEYFEAKKKEEIGIIEEEQLKLEKEKEKIKRARRREKKNKRNWKRKKKKNKNDYRDKLEKWITQLQYYYHSYHSKALIWFIKTTYYRKWIQKILCECPFNQVKEAFAELFKTVISRLAFEEKAFYSQTYRGSSLFEFDETLLLSEEDKIKEQQQLNTKSDPIIIPSSYALRIIQYCFDTLFRTDWKKSSPKYILNILSHFATLGNEEVKFLVSLDSIHKLSNFFVINCSIPIKEIIQKRKTREEQRKQLSLIYREEELQYFLPLDDPNEIGHVEANDYADLILMFSKMIRSCKIIPTSQLGTMEFNSNQPILIEEQMPEYTNFLAEAIQNKIEIKEITLLMQFLSYNNHNLSIHFINLCMEPIRSYLNHSINHAEYINILKQIIQINDEYQNFRVENIMSNLFQLARQITTQNQSKGKELCQHIFTFPKIPIINNWLQNNNWVVQETINSVGLSYRK
ncbi:ubiquitin carboxyl-terminal hydrolase [Anaeramoeba flamelloides]|uniref:Ubiquitin carboxyl-terminal hydrolase n=1 Tax=Anaeramoeba flamelloides TaxID=1746091 RepID=A0AAV7ZBE2_9EUKA|nr:ubiquitin carboxyl-terminal hydrolase [Anaeramoeba flamelloides]